MTRLEFHPIANVFPMLESAALKELADDIREHGLHEPIIRYAISRHVEATFAVLDGGRLH
jgi:ParB-like chromosome segregation protein Spo0J